MSEAFSKYYDGEDACWGNSSGGGSDPYYTIEYQAFLVKFMRMNQIRHVVDIGCGDWQFSRFVNFDGIQYHGYDVVPSVIEGNRLRYASPSKHFSLMPENLENLPKADLLLMKDVLQHLPSEQVLEFIRSVFDRYKYCLITNSFSKLETPTNVDISAGQFRALDLNAAPFHLNGAYVLEFSSTHWERIRTLLYQGRKI